MADQTVSRLVIDVVTDANDAASGFDQVSQDSQRMAADVEDAGARASRGLNVTADSTDNLASKSGQATGALGALSAGFELVGMEKYATALTSASMATDFMSGVGDSLNLVLESQAVKTAIARVNAIRHAVTSRVVAGATRVWAATQWVLNAALNANPIGLVVAAVALLIGGIILAYKKSDTFRGIIQAVGRAGKAAIGWVVDRVSDLVSWVKDHAPAAFNTLKSKASGALSALTSPFRTVINAVKDVVSWVKDKLPAGFESAKDKAQAIGSALTKPFRDLVGWVRSVIDWISKIHIPNIPGFGRVAPTSGRLAPVVDAGTLNSTGSGSVGGRPVTQVTFHTIVNGAIDPMGTADAIERVQTKAARRLGQRVI